MATKKSVKLKLGYSNTDFVRTYTYDAESEIADAKARVLAINESLAGGTDGGLADFFRADDYDDSDPNNIIGKFNRILEAQYEIVTETEINLNEE